jgi:hypothetical protein
LISLEKRMLLISKRKSAGYQTHQQYRSFLYQMVASQNDW